jgi:DeoR family ulaG and ulaABCDEF operon transcriptional repressor
MFMGVHGISILGLMEADPLLIQAEKRLIGQAEELIVLVDSSKFARRAGLVLCGLNRVSTVITDTGASDGAVQLLEQYGVKVVTVEPDARPLLPDLGLLPAAEELDAANDALVRQERLQLQAFR